MFGQQVHVDSAKVYDVTTDASSPGLVAGGQKRPAYLGLANSYRDMT